MTIDEKSNDIAASVLARLKLCPDWPCLAVAVGNAIELAGWNETMRPMLADRDQRGVRLHQRMQAAQRTLDANQHIRELLNEWDRTSNDALFDKALARFNEANLQK